MTKGLMHSSLRQRAVLRWLAAPVCVALAAGAAAQQPPMVAQPVVQSVPSQDSQALNSALARLGRNPLDVNALIDAGNAALVLGDVDAAVGFFSRADQIQPNSPRVRAGLAGALVHNSNPYDAIPLFAEAEAAGGMDPKLNTERGLAYDLVGDNATAQRYYRAALGIAPSDETTRRLALSQVIAGDRAGMEATLAPLLLRGDKAAQRVNAFGLAIAGRPEEGVAIAYKVMPQDLAAGIAPYLRYMPRLTRAQQASAAVFGHFPRAAEIGRDDPRALRFAPPVHVATAETALVPKGEPLGARMAASDKARKDKARDAPKVAPRVAVVSPPARIAPPTLNPSRDESETPSALVAKPVPTPLPTPVPAKVAIASRPAPPPPLPVTAPPATPVVIAAPTPSSSFDLAQIGKTQTVSGPVTTPPALPVAAPVAPKAAPARPASFAEAFGDLGAPDAKTAPASGAVDVRKIAAAKAKADAKPAHASRIWVQLGTGRDKAALSYTWRTLVKDNAEVLRGKSPAITEWGRTNRLLCGPFETEAAASAYLAKLKRADVDAFLWTSPAGQVVDPLTAR